MPLEPIKTRLEKIFHLTSTVRTFRFRFPEGKWVPFKAGQFCLIHVPQEEKLLKKPYSICSAPTEEGYVDLCVKLVEGGYTTNWFWGLKEGDEVTLTIPYGGFVMKEPLEDDLIFVATGTGLAPLRSMIKTLLHQGFKKQITLIFGVRYENEIFYEDEFRKLEKEHANFCFIPTISRPKEWKGETGYVQNVLKKYITAPKGKQIYMCGLIPMIDAVQAAALEIGFDKKVIHFEKYV
ncbi:MAG: oxidoreductase [Deltaproteobacteria bacterium]|nr:oxidoreductase [Deltaproteobacteria bacterium]